MQFTRMKLAQFIWRKGRGYLPKWKDLEFSQMNTSHLENSGVLLSKQLLSELCK